MRSTLLAMFLVALAGLAWAQSMLRHIDPELGFSVDYPAEWTAVAQPLFGGNAEFADPNPSPTDKVPESVTIKVIKFDTDVGLHGLANKARTDLQLKFPDASLLDSRPETWASMEGQRLLFAARFGGQPVRIVQMLGMVGNHGYELDYVATQPTLLSHQSTCDAVVQSFTVKRP